MARTNLRRLRPKEVALVADILAEPAEDVEQLAKSVVKALNAYRASEALFARVVKSEVTGSILLYGPYPTPADALADTMSFGVDREGSEYLAMVVPLHGPYGAVTEDHDESQ